MAHHYTTKAVIIGSRPSGEGNGLVLCLTKDFGLLYVSARSVRAGHSKLRGLLQPTFVGLLTLIKGKRAWKVVGAIEEKNIYFALRGKPEAQMLVLRMLLLVRRLVRGEEKNEKLFLVLEELLESVMGESRSAEDCRALERVLALRLLASLGYTTQEAELRELVVAPTITEDLIGKAKIDMRIATREINKALEAAQL